MKTVKLMVENVHKQFTQGKEKIEVLKGVDIQFIAEKTYAITGVSGTGKSTLMHIIAGLDDPDEGTIQFDGKIVHQLSAKEREQFLNQSIGLVFQNPYLIRELSVIENVMMPGLIAGTLRASCESKAKNILDKVGIGQKANSKPASLSGGQQQRVAIARALFNKPQFLLADEPTGNLDIETGKTIVDLLLSFQQEWGMGIIISSHDAYVAKSMNEVYQLSGGRLKKV